MERKKASDFPQELLNLFDGYVHGAISRREFLDGAEKFAVGGMTAAALFQMLKPNYAWAVQVPADDKRIQAEYDTVPSPRLLDVGRRIPARDRFAPDSPLEGGVSCELVSENAKFPASRENTGNFIDSGLGGASEAAKKGMKSVSYGPIPYAS